MFHPGTVHPVTLALFSFIHDWVLFTTTTHVTSLTSPKLPTKSFVTCYKSGLAVLLIFYLLFVPTLLLFSSPFSKIRAFIRSLPCLSSLVAFHRKPSEESGLNCNVAVMTFVHLYVEATKVGGALLSRLADEALGTLQRHMHKHPSIMVKILDTLHSTWRQ